MSTAALVPIEVFELKNTLYETLEIEPEKDERGVTLDQRLGVSITNAIKKDGVNIIQLQSNVDNRRVTHNIIRALKIVDNLHTSLLAGTKRFEPAKEIGYQNQIRELEHKVTNLQPPVVEITRVDEYIASDVVDWYFESGISLHDFLVTMKKKFVEIALRKFKTDKEAAERLGVKNTTMPGMKKRLGVTRNRVVKGRKNEN